MAKPRADNYQYWYGTASGIVSKVGGTLQTVAVTANSSGTCTVYDGQNASGPVICSFGSGVTESIDLHVTVSAIYIAITGTISCTIAHDG